MCSDIQKFWRVHLYTYLHSNTLQDLSKYSNKTVDSAVHIMKCLNIWIMEKLLYCDHYGTHCIIFCQQTAARAHLRAVGFKVMKFYSIIVNSGLLLSLG